MIRFGRYKLDATQGLTSGGQDVRLTAKSLAVLWLLAERAGRVVTKDELFATLWSDTAVTDSALASCIQEIRHALEDDARHPRFIETLHRRGYRFVARTSKGDVETRPEPVPPFRQETPFIGRDTEVQAVLDAFADAQRGIRQICFITGEPGVGKTAVLNKCMAEMAAPGIASTWAQCVERYGSGEPYQPLLESLMRLCRQPAGGRIVSILERYAPMWLVQLPGLLPPRQGARLQRTLAGASRDRMLRELTNAVEAIAAHDPLILAIEDLHWSDPSTLDWIAAVAPRPEPARLLIVGTLRPAAPNEGDQPLPMLYDTLRAKSLAREVALSGLDEANVSRYLAARLPPAPGRAAAMIRLGRRVHLHTGGNPLFMATVLDQLVVRGVVVRVGEWWGASDEADISDLGIPASIRPVIDRQVARLPRGERELLETASVVGDTFPVAVVAGAAAVEAGAAESTLETGDSKRFVRESGTFEMPDGGVSTELAFVHTLFRDALYQGIPRGRRVELHRRVGDTQESAWGVRAVDIAAELAVHFEEGRDFARAVRYLQYAAESARLRSAFREARVHYERALALLGRLPEGEERIERELNLRMGIGAAIMATSGFGAPEVEAAYSTARSLCRQIGDTPRLFPALWGLWLYYWGHGAVRTAGELAQELRELAEAGDDDGLRLQAMHASWATAFSEGKFGDAHAFATEGFGLYVVDRHAPMAATYGSHDPGVCAKMFAARAQAFAGRVDDAIRTSDEAITLARSLDHPFSIALSLKFRAALDQSCGDAASARDHAAEGAALASEQGFALILAWCTTIGGWAAARRGDHAGGLLAITEGIAAARRSGSDQFQSYLHGMLADACLTVGEIARGVEAVSEALALAERTGERFYEAELHRLHGELVLARGDAAGARSAFSKAEELARTQGAAMLVLRAAVRLGRLSLPPEEAGPDRDSLRAARVAMPAGVRLPDIDEADALLLA
jgi:DNA-binding winged helix-turn-helix (wHTH) protein/predicted ATPase